MIDGGIFKKYDIRGRAQGENAPVTRDAARRIGQAFGTYLQQSENKKTIVVGRDNRHTSFDLAKATIEGILASGANVIDIGLVSTPVVYWHSIRNEDAGGLMITGSHLAPEFNGFKLAVGNRNLYGTQIQEIRGLADSTRLYYSEGKLSTESHAYSKYIRDLHSRITMARPLKVVVDPGNGTGGLFAPQLFEMWGHKVTCIFCDPDGSYPNHQPDPQDAQNMIALGEKVRETGADVGIALDGDADRMGAVDEKGNLITADRLLALLARNMLTRYPGAAVVADVLSSQVLFDEVAKAGGQPVMWASGHSLVKSKMREIGALLGGEMSGHIFLGEDYFGFDDGYFAAGRLMQLIAGGNTPLSELNASLPTLYSTPEYRPYCPDLDKDDVIEGVKNALSGKGEIVDVDGIRIKFEKGWGLLRASNTEPVLSLRFEGETEADALAYRQMFVKALAKYPQVGMFA